MVAISRYRFRRLHLHPRPHPLDHRSTPRPQKLVLHRRRHLRRNDLAPRNPLRHPRRKIFPPRNGPIDQRVVPRNRRALANDPPRLVLETGRSPRRVRNHRCNPIAGGHNRNNAHLAQPRTCCVPNHGRAGRHRRDRKRRSLYCISHHLVSLYFAIAVSAHLLSHHDFPAVSIPT